MRRSILVTGCAGFIGSTVVRQWLAETDWQLTGVDILGYAGLRASIEPLLDHPRFALQVADVADGPAMQAIFAAVRPDAVLHLAAESHVDRSLDAPAAFIRTNLVGTAMLLEAARGHWERLDAAGRARFRFLQVSTDEVFGALGPQGRFDETSRYAPNSPYSASKAGADHLARAWGHSYGLPVLVSHAPNTYGPRQLPEKLIPRMIVAALAGAPLPVYGDGLQVREWLHVDDHARALRRLIEHGTPGASWCVGGGHECTNLALVQRLCALLDARRPAGAPHARLIRHVADRPGHDWRYALDGRRLREALGWQPAVAFDDGLAATVDWYLDHPAWLSQAQASLAAAR